MPRRTYKKRKTGYDLIYKSKETAKLINYIMRDGKKSVAEKLIYSAFDTIKQQNLNPIEVLHRAIKNVAPLQEVKPRRVGGASYLVPSETSNERKLFLAFNWIIKAASARSNKEYHSFDQKLSAELIDAYQEEGEAVAKKRQVEKLAEANKAFAHFRW
jgi:small subunit ribosomal protein S7